ncbi:MAG: hypothetical protein ABSA67_01530 [Candidatus Brocadiia bacterium]|jgi:hypothetical protein
MKLQRELRAGLAGCLLALAGWICAPLQAQQSAPEPEAATPAAAAFPKGLLPPHVAEQVRAIVRAQVKAFLPPSEEGAVEIDRLDKGTILTATIGGQKYSGNVFRSFLVEPLDPNEFEAMKEYYVRTTAPWPLKDGMVIPSDTYLSGTRELVSAYDRDAISAQDAAIARSDALCKKALARVEPQRNAKTAAITTAHKDDVDALSKKITEVQAEITKKEAARAQVAQRVNRSISNQPNQNQPNPGNMLAVPPSQPNQPNQAPRVTSGRDANGNLLWEWNGNGITFYDNLDQSKQQLADAYAEQKTLQATIDAEVSAAVGPRGAKERALRAIFQGHRRRILGGEMISGEDMGADYEAALGESLSAPASGKPNPADGKPPIRTVPAQKRGT